MVEKKIIILSGVFVLLLAYFLVFERQKSKEDAQNRIFNFVLADVKKIELENLILVRDEKNNKWNIIKPLSTEANTPDVNSYIGDLKDFDYDKIVSTNLEDLPKFGLDQPQKTMKIWTPDEKILKAGNRNPDNTKFYFYIEGSNKIYLTGSAKLNMFEKTSFDMRDKMVFKFDTSKVTKFNILFENKNYYASLNNATNKTWQLQKPIINRLSDEDVNNILYNIEMLRVKAFIDRNIDKKSVGLSPASIKLEFFTSDNKSYIVYIGNKTKDGYYVSFMDKEYLIDEWYVNSVLKEALKKFIIPAKKTEVKTNV